MKVALCFIGVVGGDQGKSGKGNSSRVLKIGYDHYKKHLLDKNDVDVFVHTWSVDEKDTIEKLYKPKLSIYEPQKTFKVPSYVTGTPQRKNNHYSRWYSYKKSCDLKSKFESDNGFKYDFVMMARFDIALRTDLIFDIYDTDAFYAANWCWMHKKNGERVKNPDYYLLDDTSDLVHKHIGYPHNGKGLLDQWFFSNSKNMDQFVTLFDHLDEYTKPGHCPHDVSGSISSHRLSFYHLHKIGLVDKLKFTLHLHDDFPLIRRWIFKCGK